jgi:hypothetical protein
MESLSLDSLLVYGPKAEAGRLDPLGCVPGGKYEYANQGGEGELDGFGSENRMMFPATWLHKWCVSWCGPASAVPFRPDFHISCDFHTLGCAVQQSMGMKSGTPSTAWSFRSRSGCCMGRSWRCADKAFFYPAFSLSHPGSIKDPY